MIKTNKKSVNEPIFRKAEKQKRDKSADRKSLKWIISVIHPQIPVIIAIVISEAVWAVFGTVTALFTREIINSATSKDKDRMFLFIGIYAAVALSLIVIHSVMRYINDRCRARIDILLKNRVFSSTLSKSFPELAAHHTGDLINRLTGDVSVISDAATSILPQVVMMAVRLIFAMAVLIRLEWRFAIFFAAGGIVILTLTKILKSKVQSYHKEMQEADGKTRSFWQEIYENMMVIKAFSGEKKSVKKSDELMKKHFKLRMRRSIMGTLSMFGTGFVIRLGNLFAVGYGAYRVLNGMSFGDFTALNQLVMQVQQPFASISGIMPRYYSALSSAERLMEIEALSNDSTDGKLCDAQNVYSEMKCIDIRDVSFYYDKDNPVLVNCSVSISKGDFVSITGMSGIGKSTLFKVLLDLYPKKSGDAVIVTNEREIALTGLTRTLFAYVPQGNMLFSGTIKENLLFLSNDESIGEDKIFDALKIACADEFVKELPDGIDTVIGEKGIGLSEGQVQRISVARAILSASPILLFDEATSALDEATEAKLLTNLKEMTDRTLIIVTHKKAALSICNKHLSIKDKSIFLEV